MLDFPAAFNFETPERMETIAQKNAAQAGIDRRLALAFLTKSSTELRAAVEQDPEVAEVFLSGVESLRGAIRQLEAQLELMRSAEVHVLAALSDAYTEEEQPDAAARDEAQAAGVISDEHEIPSPSFGAVIDAEVPHG